MSAFKCCLFHFASPLVIPLILIFIYLFICEPPFITQYDFSTKGILSLLLESIIPIANILNIHLILFHMRTHICVKIAENNNVFHSKKRTKYIFYSHTHTMCTYIFSQSSGIIICVLIIEDEVCGTGPFRNFWRGSYVKVTGHGE